MTPEEEKLIKEIESALYRSLTQKPDEFDNFCKKFDDKGKDYLKKELNEDKRLFMKFDPRIDRKDRFKKVLDGIDVKTRGKKFFVYGFYHNGDDRPLYIGQTKNGKIRLNQEFQMYTSAFRNFPMFFLDEIRIWSSGISTENEAILFESFLIEKLKPHFNKQNPKRKITAQQGIVFQKLLNIFDPILISNLDPDYKELFKIFS